MSPGLEILFVLGGDEALERNGLGVSRIAELTFRHKSQTSRSLKSLANLGCVERDAETMAYRLGWRLFALGARAGDSRILQAAPPLLRQLVGDLGETAHLSVLQHAEVLTLLSEPSHAGVSATGWVGRCVPASCTASGRALLFDHSLDDLRTRFEHSAFEGGPRAPRSLGDLADRLAEAVELGYAVSVEELEVGLVAVAAPLRDAKGQIVAALNVSGPSFRLGGALHQAGRTVQSAAEELSGALGHQAANGRKVAEPAGRAGL